MEREKKRQKERFIGGEQAPGIRTGVHIEGQQRDEVGRQAQWGGGGSD